MKSFLRKFLYTGIVVIVFLIAYSIIFDSVAVNDKTMANSILPGQDIFVFKAGYGIKLPFIEEPIITYSSPQRNDIIAFHLPKYYDIPVSEKPKKISRCVGLPGDTLQIFSKNVLINGKKIQENENIQYQYRIVSKNGLLKKSFFNKYDLQQVRLISELGVYDIPLTEKMSVEISKDKLIANVRLLEGKTGYDLPPIFPVSPYYSFTKDNFGTVVVPSRNWKVPINIRNIDLYKRIIGQYENNNIKIEKGEVYINNQIASSYTFKNNYYFVLDDNRDKAEDSRHWGFLPENHIIGEIINSGL